MTLEPPRFTRERIPDEKHEAENDVTDIDTLLLFPFHLSLSLPLCLLFLSLSIHIVDSSIYIYLSLIFIFLHSKVLSNNDVMNTLKVERSGLSKCYRMGGGEEKGKGSRQLQTSYQLILL